MSTVIAAALRRYADDEPDKGKAGTMVTAAHAIDRMLLDIARLKGLSEGETSVMEGVELERKLS